MDTVVGSRTTTVVIGPDRPFTIIGERINPTNRPRLSEELARGDLSRVEADALAQIDAGAHLLDVNAGVPLTDEPAILAACVRHLQTITDTPLCIDSSVVAALEAGLDAYEGKALVNSVTGEEEVLEQVLPLVARHGAAVIGIANDETGISEDPAVRVAVARRIVERAADHGIPAEDVVIDPLAMPAGAMAGAGRQVFEIVRRLRDELGVNTSCGASNVSFGLPARDRLNAHFVSMAAAAGMTAAIANPCDPAVRSAVAAVDVLLGHDENCMAWIAANREGAAGNGARARRRRDRTRDRTTRDRSGDRTRDRQAAGGEP